MYPNRSEHSHSRQYSDRNSRQWDSYEDRRERRDSHRDALRDSHHKYGSDGLNSSERTSRSREYSDSPTRPYSKDSSKRERSRKSPVRRRLSSPDWASSENKRQRFTEDDEDDYRYRRVPEDKACRQSPDSFSRVHGSKDFKCGPPQEQDFSYRKTTQDSRHRYRQEEFTYRQQQHDDVPGRRSSGYYKDRDSRERSWDRSPERKRSQEHSKGYVKTRMRNNSPYRDHPEYQNRSRFPMNASTGQQAGESSAGHHSATVPEQKSTKGFQRFLDVLNKGVNVDTLTKIVTQTSENPDHRSPSPTSFTSAADHQWSPISSENKQGSRLNTRHWSENDGSKRLSSPQPQRRSYSPVGGFLSEEKSHHVDDGKQSCFSSGSRSRSPSVAEKITLTPEEEHKRKQMQDVLQAIGLNLGFEELGQMSHRIQERLYGKKDGDVGHHGRGSGEKEPRRAYSPRRHNRSSSSRSSFSPSPRDYYMKKDSDSAQSDVTQAHQAVEYAQNSSKSVLQESEASETNSHESPAVFSESAAYTYPEQLNSQKSPVACQAFPENPAYTFSEPPPAPVMPMYSPVSCSPLPYPGLPPSLPHVQPGLLLPRLPPFLPYPRVPPLNIFPAMLSQRQLLPQHLSNPPLLTLPIQPLNNAQKSKPLSRPRCLQVIETKQPG